MFGVKIRKIHFCAAQISIFALNIFMIFSGDNYGCGGILTSPSEFLMTESTQKNCQWTIRLHETKVIVFKILEIQMDEGSNCNDQYLKVKYGQKIYLSSVLQMWN